MGDISAEHASKISVQSYSALQILSTHNFYIIWKKKDIPHEDWYC